MKRHVNMTLDYLCTSVCVREPLSYTNLSSDNIPALKSELSSYTETLEACCLARGLNALDVHLGITLSMTSRLLSLTLSAASSTSSPKPFLFQHAVMSP